jgi:uncharacterized membrane protein
MSSSIPAPPPAPPRRTYIDWLRGLAVVTMIEAHTFDSWTVLSVRDTLPYWYIQVIAGAGAPIFLFLAGVSVALASGSKLRRGLDDFDASRAMQRRGLQIFALALLFRVQAFVLSPGATLYGILKVDILNIMGPAIVGAALVWGLARGVWKRAGALSAAAALFALLTPLVRSSTLMAALPDPIEWYFRPWAGRTTFTFFPWAGFVFAGAAVGVLIDRARDASHEARLNLALGLGGLSIAGAAYAASYWPSPYPESSFWTSSPCFFFLRVGLLVSSLGAAYLWMRRPTAHHFSPLLQFGRTSLFIYWIHVELVYGFISTPLHKKLTLPQACVAFLLFTALMFWVSMWKTRVVAEWEQRHDTAPAWWRTGHRLAAAWAGPRESASRDTRGATAAARSRD